MEAEDEDDEDIGNDQSGYIDQSVTRFNRLFS